MRNMTVSKKEIERRGEEKCKIGKKSKCKRTERMLRREQLERNER